MNAFTKEDVDSKFKEIEEFERLIPGIRYGEDYPQFALAIVSSDAFKAMVQTATMLGLLSAVTMPKKMDKFAETEEGSKGLMEEFTRNSPMKEALLRALYLGYKLGKQA